LAGPTSTSGGSLPIAQHVKRQLHEVDGLGESGLPSFTDQSQLLPSGRAVEVMMSADYGPGGPVTTETQLPPEPRRPVKGGTRRGSADVASPLPVHCMGAACLARSALMAMAEKCRDDRACWERELGLRKGQEGLVRLLPATDAAE